MAIWHQHGLKCHMSVLPSTKNSTLAHHVMSILGVVETVQITVDVKHSNTVMASRMSQLKLSISLFLQYATSMSQPYARAAAGPTNPLVALILLLVVMWTRLLENWHLTWPRSCNHCFGAGLDAHSIVLTARLRFVLNWVPYIMCQTSRELVLSTHGSPGSDTLYKPRTYRGTAYTVFEGPWET